MRILFAEDEPKINTIVEEALKKDGYTVDAVMDGKEAISYWNIYEYDLVLLDLMMVSVNGDEVMKHIRKSNKNIPIIALTARSDLETKVTNLDNGFDDYITKPFKMEELKARIRVHLRKYTSREIILSVQHLTLNPSSKIVKWQNNDLALTAKEYSILEYLLRHKNKYKSETDIYDNIWDHGSEIGSNVIAAHIKNLKKKIDEAGGNSNIIESERGKGYIIKENNG